LVSIIAPQIDNTLDTYSALNWQKEASYKTMKSQKIQKQFVALPFETI